MRISRLGTGVPILAAALACGLLTAPGVAAAERVTVDAAVVTGLAHHAKPKPKPAPAPRTIATGLISPLKLHVTSSKNVLVTQNFAGLLSSVTRSGTVSTLHAASVPGTEVGAVSARGGTVIFAESTEEGGALLKQRTAKGKVTTIADLGKVEARTNPDGKTLYGFRTLSKACAAEVAAIPDNPFGGATFRGEVYSHPYATTSTKSTTYVADAGANVLWSVSKKGKVRALHTFAPVKQTVTPELADELGLPACTHNEPFWANAVPTDVEIGPRGQLYVTTLPGFPEAPGAGAVHRIDPRTGKAKQIATGLSGATDLAVSDSGDVYVTELFANRISKIARGSSTPKQFLPALLPGAVEIHHGTLYATTGVLIGLGPDEEGNPAPPGGELISVTLPKSR